ncbi:hypothetical protein [Mesorhizobium sp. CN2-181]|uniref:hypothetical protein n=1 Tax=Mesorhizobium yinganensis TaxID=3157707 RepID=UPI0032B6FC0F
MAEVDGELVYELLRRIQSDLSEVKFDVHELKKRMTGADEALAGVNRRLDHQDDRLERIERRLDLHELAEAQKPYGPK